jgi:beta-glucanase (GH16 family)
MKKRNHKGRLAIAVAFALSLSSLSTAGLQAFAFQGPVNESLALPFGQLAEYNPEQGIGFVWGAAGYDKYTVTISCEANGYEKVYTDQALGYHWYPDDYKNGEYLIELQGQLDGEYTGAVTATVTIGNATDEPDEPGIGDSGEDEPGIGDSGEDEPGIGDSGEDEPGIGDSGEDEPGIGDSEEEQEEDDNEVKEGSISLADAETELYVGSDWAGCNASVKETGTKAEFNVGSYGWNGEWGLQYIIKNLGLQIGETYTLSADLTSSIDKKVNIKLDDSGQIYDFIDLAAGKTYHYKAETTITQIANDYLFFALGQMLGEPANLSGTLTIENLRICDSNGNYITLSGGSATGSKGPEYDFSASDNYLYDYADQGAAKDGYDLIWADEFDGNYATSNVDSATGLNLDNWGYQLGDGSTDCGNYGWGNNELECYTANPRNISVNEDLDGDGIADGLLRITAAYEEDGYNYAGESRKNYTSARIRTTTATQELFNSTYGYIEGRISLPQTKGAWPAFWMLPQSTSIYGGWPVSGEIDILETTGTQTNQACSTIHWGVPSHVYKGSGYRPLDSDIRYFHTYAVDWEPGKMTFYYDDKEIYSSSNWASGLSGASDALGFDAPFDAPFYMILNLAVDSGQFGGSANKADFTDDINMYVDYIRCFQKSDGYPASVTKTTEDGSRSDWADYQGINQIADITESNLDVTGGGHDDNAAAGSGKWYLSYQSDASANAETIVDSEGNTWAKINVTGQGSQDYGVQLIGHYNAKAGYVYKVSYDSYAEGGLVGKQVNCDSKEYAGWSTYGIQAFSLTDSPAHNSYIFEQTEDFDNCRIEFNIGGQSSGTVYVSNVKVEIVDPASLGTTDSNGVHGVLADGNMIFNGTFDQGNNHTGYWTAANGTTLNIPRYTLSALKDSDVRVKDIASMTNYENIPDGFKYYERRGQVSAQGDASPTIYQSGIKMTADTYSLSFDLYSDSDSAVKASIHTMNADENGNMVLGKELGSAKASYSAANGVKRYTLNITTTEDTANGAVVLTFAKGTGVQIDNVTMHGENQASTTDETPIDEATTWSGDSGAGSSIAIATDENGVHSMTGIASGSTWYSPQIGSSNFSVLAGLKYKLSFDYKITGNSNGTFKYIVQENGGSWIVVQDIVQVDSKNLTADEEGFYHYETVFTAGASMDDCHLNYGFGDSGATGDMTFFFKNVSMTLVKEGSGGGSSDNDDDVDEGIFDPTPVTPVTPVEPEEPVTPEEPEPEVPEVPAGSFVNKWLSTYYVLEDGTYYTGMLTVDGNKYYFKANGIMIVSDYLTLDGKTYYFDKEGHMVTGFMTKWGTTYYFNEEGVQQFDTMVDVDGYTYYLNAKGKLVISSFVDFEDGTRFFDSEGHMAKDTTITRWFKKYTFDENGILVK